MGYIVFTNSDNDNYVAVNENNTAFMFFPSYDGSVVTQMSKGEFNDGEKDVAWAAVIEFMTTQNPPGGGM